MSASRFPCITANFTLCPKRVYGTKLTVQGSKYDGEDICRSAELAFMKETPQQEDCDYEGTPFIRTVLKKSDVLGEHDEGLKPVGFVMPVYGNCNEKISIQMSGIVTVVNNSKDGIVAGSKIYWSNPSNADWELSNGRARRHPSDRNRYVAVLHPSKKMKERMVGTALTSAKKGQTYSLHVQLGG